MSEKRPDSLKEAPPATQAGTTIITEVGAEDAARGPIGLPERIGPYRIQGVLAVGGMGVVYRAAHAATGVDAAVKVVKLPHGLVMQNFRREIAALACIEHPGIVRILDEGAADGHPWYAMQLVDGLSLRAHAHQAFPGVTRSTLPALLTLIRRMCAALAYLHGEGIVHRDLKPENVVVTRGGAPVLVDFGLATQFAGRLRLEILQESSRTEGTVAYMAPEQIAGAIVDARADLYALGCILYELLAGRRPFIGNLDVVLDGHLRQSPPPLAELVPGLPPGVYALVEHLLAKRPRERLAYAEDVGALLERLGAEGGAEPSPRPRAYLYNAELAGRQDALGRLVESVLGPAAAGSGLLFVRGEGGMGKTRFLVELARAALARGARVLMGECSPDGGQPLEGLSRPLKAVADLCNERGPDVSERILGPRGKILATVERELGSVAGQERYPDPPPAPAKEARPRLFEALAATFTALAGEFPLLILIDDLHWADELTLAFLEFVRAEQPAGRARFWIAAAFRPEDPIPEIQTLMGRPGVTRHELSRIGEDAVGTMVGDMLALAPPPPVLSRYLSDHSEGNPFFVAEYLRLAVEQGLLVRDQRGVWQLPELGHPAPTRALYEPMALPSSLRLLVEERFQGLDEAALRVLSAAAVLGRSSGEDLLAEVAGLDDDHLLRATSELVRRHILEDADDGGMRLTHDQLRDGGMRFTHDKLRDVAYDLIRADTRAGLHLATAEILVRRATAGGDGDLEQHAAEIAGHYRHAGAPLQAARYARMAGRCAVRTAALADALQHYQHALASVAELEESPEVLRLQVELRLEQYSPRFQLYSAADSGLGELVRSALPFARKLGDAALLAKMEDYTLLPLFAQGKPGELLAAGRPLLARAQAAGDFARVGAIAYLVVTAHLQRGELREAVELARPIITAMEERGLTRELCGQPYPPYLTLCGVLGVALTHLGELDAGASWLDRTVAIAPSMGVKYGVAVSHMWWSLALARDPATILTHGDMAATIARAQKLAAPEMLGSYGAGRGLALMGRAGEAIARLTRALAMSESLGYVAFRSDAYLALALAHLETGALEQAAAAAAEGLCLVASRGESRLEAELRRVRAEIELRRSGGDLALATEELGRSLAVAERQGARVFAARARASLGRCHARRGALDAARAELARAAADLSELGLTVEADAARADLSGTRPAPGDSA